MNRKLAVAGSLAAAVAFVSGAVMVGALLSAPPDTLTSPDLATAGVDPDPSTVTSLDPVVVYQDEYEYVVTGGGVTPVASASGAASNEEVAGPSASPQGTSGPAAAPAPVPVPATAFTGPPVTAAPAPATTTTTRPPGVPDDWPADKPIPPMPAGCRDGQLEDNGVWNCQH